MEERIARLIYEERLKTAACADAHATIIATSLRSRPARRLLWWGAGGLHAAARTRRHVLQAPRRISATVYRARYRVSEANELLRALNGPEARASSNEPGRRPSRKLARGRGARCRSWLRCERRVRERSAAAAARAASAWRAACSSSSWSCTTPDRPSWRAAVEPVAPSRNAAAIVRELAVLLELAHDGALRCRSRREASGQARGARSSVHHARRVPDPRPRVKPGAVSERARRVLRRPGR